MRKWSCPLCTRKQTCAVQWLMSALGQKRTLSDLFDHLVGAILYRLRHSNAECLGGLDVDIQLDLGGLLDRQVSRLIAFQNPAGVDAGRTKRVRKTGSVAHEAAGRCELARLVDRGHGVTNRQCRELFEPATEEWIGADHERA